MPVPFIALPCLRALVLELLFVTALPAFCQAGAIVNHDERAYRFKVAEKIPPEPGEEKGRRRVRYSSVPSRSRVVGLCEYPCTISLESGAKIKLQPYDIGIIEDGTWHVAPYGSEEY